MAHGPKIATCCYCGARAALVLDSGRHELACGSCGAPLHDLKRLPVQALSQHRDNPRLPARQESTRKSRDDRESRAPKRVERKPPKRKKRKSFARWLVSEAVDVIEDIFD